MGYSNYVLEVDEASLQSSLPQIASRHRFHKTPRWMQTPSDKAKIPRNVYNLIPEKGTNRFSMVDTTNSLGKDIANFQNFQLRAQSAVLLLGDAICDDNLI